MRIPGDASRVTGVYEQQKGVGRVSKADHVASKKDVLSISSQAKDFQTVYRALRDVPDMRQARVNELVQQYEAGKYDIDGKDVIDKVIKNTFDKKA